MVIASVAVRPAQLCPCGPFKTTGFLGRSGVASRSTLNDRLAPNIQVVDIEVLEELSKCQPSVCLRILILRIRDRDHHEPAHKPIWKLKRLLQAAKEERLREENVLHRRAQVVHREGVRKDRARITLPFLIDDTTRSGARRVFDAVKLTRSRSHHLNASLVHTAIDINRPMSEVEPRV